MRRRALGNPTDRAWIAGWDASLTYTGNPYKRAPQLKAFDRGKAAGNRAGVEDVRRLKQCLTNVRCRTRKESDRVRG